MTYNQRGLDSFSKIESVKGLHRFGIDVSSFRGFCSRTVLLGASDEVYNQYEKPRLNLRFHNMRKDWTFVRFFSGKM